MSKKVINKNSILESNLRNLKGELSDFKSFISRGNVVDMAVGVIIGGSFGKIVTSLVNDILTPMVGIFLGGVNFSNLSIRFGNANISYGFFVQTVIDFFIISLCIFLCIKLFEKFRKEELREEVISKSEEVLILEEIRDLLKDKK